MNDFHVKRVLEKRNSVADYDVNVIALFHYQDPYKTRVQWFKSLGLINRQNRRVHVTAVCSVGDGPLEEIATGWPTDIDVTVLELSSIHPVPKLNGAYLWLRDHPVAARWLLRVDDDSVTDVDGLLARYDARFGTMAVHLMTSPHVVPSGDQLRVDLRDYLEDRNIPYYSLLNEYEASLTSAAAVRRIFGSPCVEAFLEHTAVCFDKPGDKCLAFAARMVGVPTPAAEGMSHRFGRDALSIVGGGLQHIHYVKWQDQRFREMLWAFEYGQREAAAPLAAADLVGRSIEFGRCVGAMLARLTFDPDGVLRGSLHENESRWNVVAGTLRFEDPTGKPTTVFDTVLIGERTRWLIGPSMLGAQKHYLTLDPAS